MFRYETLPVTPFAHNCSLVWCDRTMEGALLHPGWGPVPYTPLPLPTIYRVCTSCFSCNLTTNQQL